jgi:dipeptide/tripeptide permease
MARSMLALHLASPPPEGFGMSTPAIGSAFLQLSLLSVVSPIAGGLVAMGVGPAMTLAIGAFIASAGYAVLGTGGVEALPLALALIAGGTGLCRPSGLALAASELRHRPESIRSALFFLLYAAINMGALVGPAAGGLGGSSAGLRVVFGISAGIALLAAFVGGGLVAALRFTGGSIDAPPSPGGRAGIGVLLLWLALAPSFIMQAAQHNAQFTLFGGPSGTFNTALRVINPIVVVVVSLGGCAALLVIASISKWTVPTLVLIGAALVAWGLASGLLAAAPRGGDLVPLLIGVSVVSAAGEAVVGPLAVARAASISSPRYATLVVAGWLAATSGLSMIGHAAVGLVDARWVAGVAAALSVIAGIALAAFSRPLQRAFFSEAPAEPRAWGGR